MFSVGANNEVNEAVERLLPIALQMSPATSGLVHLMVEVTLTTVVTGFKPRFLLTKNTSAHYWWVVDSERATGNPFGEILHPNVTDAKLIEAQTKTFL